MVSVGIISPMKNYLKVLMALENMKANIHYDIYGPIKEPGYWEECLTAIKKLAPNVQVEYHKEMPPHKIADTLKGQHVFILPSESENYGHAMVEALSAGLPVISSNHVPWLGLKEEEAGINLESTTEAIKEGIEYFVAMDQVIYNRYAEGAGLYIRSRINMEDLKRAYKEMF